MGRPTKWREQFIADMARHGQSVELARKFLRVGATLQRLAEAQCNGDYPADNGEREVTECGRCKGLYAPETLSKAGMVCQDCRAGDRALELVPAGWKLQRPGRPSRLHPHTGDAGRQRDRCSVSKPDYKLEQSKAKRAADLIEFAEATLKHLREQIHYVDELHEDEKGAMETYVSAICRIDLEARIRGLL